MKLTEDQKNERIAYFNAHPGQTKDLLVTMFRAAGSNERSLWRQMTILFHPEKKGGSLELTKLLNGVHEVHNMSDEDYEKAYGPVPRPAPNVPTPKDLKSMFELLESRDTLRSKEWFQDLKTAVTAASRAAYAAPKAAPSASEINLDTLYKEFTTRRSRSAHEQRRAASAAAASGAAPAAPWRGGRRSAHERRRAAPAAAASGSVPAASGAEAASRAAPAVPLVVLARECITAHEGAASASIEGMTAEQVAGFRVQYRAFNAAMKHSLNAFAEMRLDWQGQEDERQSRLTSAPHRIAEVDREIALVEVEIKVTQALIEQKQKNIAGFPKDSQRSSLAKMGLASQQKRKEQAVDKLAELKKERAALQSEQTNSSPHLFWARTFVKPLTHTQIEAKVQETFKLYVRFMNEPQNPDRLNELQDNLEQWRNLCRLTGGGKILRAVGNLLACIALTVLTAGAESQRPWVDSFYRAARDAAYGKLPDGLRDIEEVCQKARGQGDNPLIKTQALSDEETVSLRDMDEAHEEGASATPGRP